MDSSKSARNACANRIYQRVGGTAPLQSPRPVLHGQPRGLSPTPSCPAAFVWLTPAMWVQRQRALIAGAVALLEGGTSPHSIDKEGRTALHYCARRPSCQAVLRLAETLIKYGADVDAVDARGALRRFDWFVLCPISFCVTRGLCRRGAASHGSPCRQRRILRAASDAQGLGRLRPFLQRAHPSPRRGQLRPHRRGRVAARVRSGVHGARFRRPHTDGGGRGCRGAQGARDAANPI